MFYGDVVAVAPAAAAAAAAADSRAGPVCRRIGERQDVCAGCVMSSDHGSLDLVTGQD